MEQIQQYLEKNLPDFLAQLKTFCKYESISTDPKYKNQVLSCAEYLATKLKEIGLENIQLIPTENHPLIYADWLKQKNKPTVLIYGHYDVQPPDPLDQWLTPAFEPTIRNNKFYCRGIADDKGQIFCHLKSIEAYLKIFNQLPINLKIILEGEEEIGSPNLRKFCFKNKKLLAAETILVSDTNMYSKTQPSLNISLRGLLALELIVTTAKTDLHSGLFGGAAPNAIEELTKIISKLKNSNHQILIPGFYQGIGKIEPSLKAACNLKQNEKNFQASYGIKEIVGEANYNIWEKLWIRPTLECNGIIGGYVNEGIKTVIPCQAKAKLTLRLVGEQDPKKIFKDLKKYLNEIKPKYLNLDLVFKEGAFPVQISAENLPSSAAIRAIKNIWHKKTILEGSGASIPVISDLVKNLHAAPILLGFGLLENQIHAPNENMSINQLLLGTKTIAQFFTEYGNLV